MLTAAGLIIIAEIHDFLHFSHTTLRACRAQQNANVAPSVRIIKDRNHTTTRLFGVASFFRQPKFDLPITQNQKFRFACGKIPGFW